MYCLAKKSCFYLSKGSRASFNHDKACCLNSDYTEINGHGCISKNIPLPFYIYNNTDSKPRGSEAFSTSLNLLSLTSSGSRGLEEELFSPSLCGNDLPLPSSSRAVFGNVFIVLPCPWPSPWQVAGAEWRLDWSRDSKQCLLEWMEGMSNCLRFQSWNSYTTFRRAMTRV